jgi:hypothetical protein
VSSGVARAFGTRNENYELFKKHNHLTFIWLSDLKFVGHKNRLLFQIFAFPSLGSAVRVPQYPLTPSYASGPENLEMFLEDSKAEFGSNWRIRRQCLCITRKVQIASRICDRSKCAEEDGVV